MEKMEKPGLFFPFLPFFPGSGKNGKRDTIIEPQVHIILSFLLRISNCTSLSNLAKSSSRWSTFIVFSFFSGHTSGRIWKISWISLQIKSNLAKSRSKWSTFIVFVFFLDINLEKSEKSPEYLFRSSPICPNRAPDDPLFSFFPIGHWKKRKNEKNIYFFRFFRKKKYLFFSRKNIFFSFFLFFQFGKN